MAKPWIAELRRKFLFDFFRRVAECTTYTFQSTQHAHGENREKPIGAECLYTGDRIELRVHDHSAGFELPDCIPPPTLTIERGRGLYLISAMMHQVQYLRGEGSNTLVMHRRRKKA